jgi:dUTP pyrophosphatase
MKLNVKYLNSNLPILASKDGDSGYDIRASIDKALTIPARGIATIPAGICIEVSNYPTENNMSVEIQIRPRSGMTKNGIVAQLGTVDASYRGELKVNVFNFNDQDVEIKPFDRIAQIVICPIYKPEVYQVESLSETERGDKGFGSSGKN